MRPTTTEQVFELLDAATTSAALGAALEHNLFSLLAAGPRKASEVSTQLGVTASRGRNWLELLCSLDLVSKTPRGYQTSDSGKSLILDAYQAETWAFLARAARHQYPAVVDLALTIKEAASAWERQGLTPPDYIEALRGDPEEARRFTRMLYEIHLPLAEELAQLLDLSDAAEILDLGGGSGVVSLALLDRHPDLQSTVVDIDNVCAAGRDIVKERGLSERVTYRALDFTRDALPSGFDRVVYCDVGPYTSQLFMKIRDALTEGGRLILVDQFSPAPGVPPPPRLVWAFLGSLQNPDSKGFATAASVLSLLEDAGFQRTTQFDVPSRSDIRWASGWQVIEAWK